MSTTALRAAAILAAAIGVAMILSAPGTRIGDLGILVGAAALPLANRATHEADRTRTRAREQSLADAAEYGRRAARAGSHTPTSTRPRVIPLRWRQRR